MDGLSSCPQHFVSNKDRDWLTNTHGSEENNKLELTLAPPGPQKWSFTSTTLKHTSSSNQQGHETHDSLLSLGHHHQQPSWPGSAPKFLQFPPPNDELAAAAAAGKESTLHYCRSNSTKMAELQRTRNNNDAAEKIGFLPSVSATNTAVPQKRTAPGPVVGWPPLRSFRKNLATTTSTTTNSKQSPETESQNGKHGKKAVEGTTPTPAKGLFVKINMDGIPIGRKLDLSAYDSYQKLSSAVDKLFRGLLAAQTYSFANGILSNLEEGKPITGLLDGSGEYTLVYEDNEGDRVLVGDVPWRMFVSTVKRLRVLKTSELPSLSLGVKQQKMEQSP